MITELTETDIEWMNNWIKRIYVNAERIGCEGEEVNGFIIDKWERCKLNRVKLEYTPVMEKLVPWLVRKIDIKNNEGEELEFDIPCEKFVKMMGVKFREIEYARISSNIRRILLIHGLNVKMVRIDGIKYYRFYALNEDEVRHIEERMMEGIKRRACRRMARKVCEAKIREDYDDGLKDSIWTDAEFVSSIVQCNFDVDKMNKKINKEKEKIVYDKLMYGLRLLWGGYDDRISQ